jgi:GH24 family phage-related lysozyme (muramidase)
MPAPLRDVPDEGIELIKSFEGIPDGDPSTVNIDAYIDPVGIWTIGWGHAIPFKGDFLRGAENKATARALYPGGITKAQAEALLRGDLVDTAAAVASLVKVDIDDGQFGALVAFAFNVGIGALGKSTLLRLLNGGDTAGAADQFLAWDKGRVNGVLQSLPGLTRRRTAERALFLGQEWRTGGASRGATRGRIEAVDPTGRARPETPAATRAPKAVKTAKATTAAKAPKGSETAQAPKAAAPKQTPKARAPAKKAAAPRTRGATASARTTAATSPPPAAPAKRPAPRKAR